MQGEKTKTLQRAHCTISSDSLQRTAMNKKKELNLKKGILNALTSVFYSVNYKVCLNKGALTVRGQFRMSTMCSSNYHIVCSEETE